MGWSEQMASRLVQNIRDYSQSKGPFAGGLSDGEQWWESLMFPLQNSLFNPLHSHYLQLYPMQQKLNGFSLALVVYTQSVKHSRLTVQNFEMLGMLRNHYSYVLNKEWTLAGEPTHWHKLHVHT
jgi:GH43 family beta-xylosidase